MALSEQCKADVEFAIQDIMYNAVVAFREPVGKVEGGINKVKRGVNSEKTKLFDRLLFLDSHEQAPIPFAACYPSAKESAHGCDSSLQLVQAHLVAVLGSIERLGNQLNPRYFSI